MQNNYDPMTLPLLYQLVFAALYAALYILPVIIIILIIKWCYSLMMVATSNDNGR